MLGPAGKETNLTETAYATLRGDLLDFTATAPPISTPDLIISEFLADNQTGLSDGEGDREDWIEIFNPNPVAVNLDAFFLEYDDERSGDFRPLRYLSKGKIVVLGLVTTKFGEMESKDDLKRRIDEAAKYAPLDQLCISPQCGFSSTVHGNNIAVEAQRNKSRLVIETAQEVWGN